MGEESACPRGTEKRERQRDDDTGVTRTIRSTLSIGRSSPVAPTGILIFLGCLSVVRSLSSVCCDVSSPSLLSTLVLRSFKLRVSKIFRFVGMFVATSWGHYSALAYDPCCSCPLMFDKQTDDLMWYAFVDFFIA